MLRPGQSKTHHLTGSIPTRLNLDNSTECSHSPKNWEGLSIWVTARRFADRMFYVYLVEFIGCSYSAARIWPINQV